MVPWTQAFWLSDAPWAILLITGALLITASGVIAWRRGELDNVL